MNKERTPLFIWFCHRKTGPAADLFHFSPPRPGHQGFCLSNGHLGLPLWRLTPLSEMGNLCAERILRSAGNQRWESWLGTVRPSSSTAASPTWPWAQLPDSSPGSISWLPYRQLKIPPQRPWVLSALCYMGCSEVSSSEGQDEAGERVKSQY